MDLPWSSTDLPLPERVELLLASMTLPEKVGQLHQQANVHAVADREALRAGAIGSSLIASGATAGNQRDAGVAARTVNEIQRVAVQESRLGIPLLIARDVIHGHRTVFPIPLGQAATWDAGLVEGGARAAAVEASADGIGWTFAPMVDIGSDHRWGRVAESFGEDPVLAGQLAAATVRGFQTDDLSAPDALAACVKHYVGYGLAEGGRDYNSVTAGEINLRNLQLRPFHDCVRAGVSTLMASFNDIDGVPAHANRRYVREILKQEWGFTGAVVSDWNGIAEIVRHRVAEDLRDAARQALEAGLDLDMVSSAYAQHLAGLVQDGVVDVGLVDDAVRRVLALKLRCGLFEHPYTDESRAALVIRSDGHRAAARATAAASLVLLKNSGVLPLTPEDTASMLLTGPLLDATDALLGTWTLDGRPEDVVTIAQGIRERMPADQAVSSVPWTHGDQVVQAARQVDTVVAFVGEHPVRSGEANSVTTLELPPGQLELLQAVHAVGVRLVVVVLAGRALSMPWLAEHADALVWAGHPGSEGGHAVADVLFGAVGPRGRLPMTLPRSTGQLPLVYNSRSTGRPISPAEDRFRGRYQDSLGSPLYPFGHGLTYGSVSYSPVSLGGDRLALPAGSLTATVTVTNQGAACTEVVQAYVRDEVAAVTRPVKELYDWQVVDLAAGQSKTVTFSLDAVRLGYSGPDGRHRVDPGRFVVWLAPDSASGQPAPFSLEAEAAPFSLQAEAAR